MTMTLSSWLEDRARLARHDPETYRHLGFADLRLVVEAISENGTARRHGVVLDGYDVTYVGAIDDVSSFGADATISGPASVWQEMAENIRAHGGADRYHTLNAMTIADEPLCVTSEDPMGRDKFFRYAETLQTFFDGSRQALATVD